MLAIHVAWFTLALSQMLRPDLDVLFDLSVLHSDRIIRLRANDVAREPRISQLEIRLVAWLCDEKGRYAA